MEIFKKISLFPFIFKNLVFFDGVPKYDPLCTDLVEHLPSLLSFVNPMLVTLGVHRVKLGVHVRLSDEHDEVVLGEAAPIVLCDTLDGGEVVLTDFYVVRPVERNWIIFNSINF